MKAGQRERPDQPGYRGGSARPAGDVFDPALGLFLSSACDYLCD